MTRADDREHTYRLWWGNLRERSHLVDLAALGRVILRIDLQEIVLGFWSGLIRLRTGTGEEFVCAQ
jgi:hypothetical protein